MYSWALKAQLPVKVWATKLTHRMRFLNDSLILNGDDVSAREGPSITFLKTKPALSYMSYIYILFVLLFFLFSLHNNRANSCYVILKGY